VYCSKCGSTIADGSVSCSKCGQSTYGAPVLAVSGAPLTAIPAVGPSWLPAPALTHAYAGFWLRFLAYIIDAIVLGVFIGPILVGAAMIMGLATAIGSLPHRGDPFSEGFPPVFAGFIAIFLLVTLIGTWLYHALLESSEWQATAGKKVLGLVVTDLGGARTSFGRASGRHFAKIITGLVPLGIGYILAGFTEKKQALHDMIAGCLVLRKA
jgi:uncharacterized RDD family membrane protein YckC